MGASDLHVVAGRPPLFRLVGELLPHGEPLPPDTVETMLLRLRALERGAIRLGLGKHVKGRITSGDYEPLRFRFLPHQVIEAGRRAFSESVFAVPAGFTRQNIMDAKAKKRWEVIRQKLQSLRQRLAGARSPGGASLHNSMTGHGPDAATFEKASNADLSRPDVITDTMAFMFESRHVIRPTAQALAAAHRQKDYQACWQGLKRNFTPDRA